MPQTPVVLNHMKSKFIRIALALVTFICSCRPYLHQVHQVELQITDEKGKVVQGVSAQASYPTSSDLVSAVTDSSGRCTLKFSGYTPGTRISIYLKKDLVTEGQVVVSFPDSMTKVERGASLGSYIEYGSDSNIQKRHVLKKGGNP